MAKYVTLHDTDDEIIYPQISTDSITNGSLTADKMASTVETYEKYFEYVQDATTSSNIDVDVPIDFAEYQVIKIEMFGEPSAGSSDWGTAAAISADKSTAYDCKQRGIQIDGNSTVSGIYRINQQIIAWGTNGSQSGHCSIVIKHGNLINWPIFNAFGYGADRGQWLQGRIETSPTNVGYIRVVLKAPNEGSWVRAYGLK